MSKMSKRFHKVRALMKCLCPWLEERLDFPHSPVLHTAPVDTFTNLMADKHPELSRNVEDFVRLFRQRSQEFQDEIDYFYPDMFKNRATGRPVFLAQLIYQEEHYYLVSEQEKDGQCRYLHLLYLKNEVEQDYYSFLIPSLCQKSPISIFSFIYMGNFSYIDINSGKDLSLPKPKRKRGRPRKIQGL